MISSVLSLHQGTLSTQYTVNGVEHTAEVFQRLCREKGLLYVYRDHDQQLTFDCMLEAITYLFDQHGIS